MTLILFRSKINLKNIADFYCCFFLFFSDLSSLNFHRCPTAYCCSSTKCNSYNQCATNRYGRLCSRSVPFANVFIALHMATQSWALWLIYTARDGDRDRGREAMGFYMTLCTVHITQGQGRRYGAIVFSCAHPVPCPCPCPYLSH